MVAYFYFFGFLVPCLLQVFVFESSHLQYAASCLCICTLANYLIFMLIQIYYQEKSYFAHNNNRIDIFLLIVYVVYFAINYYDNRAYLPEHVLSDGDYDKLGRRLARGGKGGGGGTGGTGGTGSAVRQREDTSITGNVAERLQSNWAEYEPRSV